MKQKLVDEIFSSVADKYDLMNDLMSFGMHRLWKREMMNFMQDKSGSLLDIASGSGDIAFNYLKQARSEGKCPSVTMCDINSDMLVKARDKLVDRGYAAGINLVVGNAESLPLQSHSFNYCAIAFGIRNVTDIISSLKEAQRVLKNGGRFICMEFSPPGQGMLHKLYDLFSLNLIPEMGKFVTGNRKAYEYLVESIRSFPSKEKLLDMIKASGFASCGYKTLSSGIVVIHHGYKKH